MKIVWPRPAEDSGHDSRRTISAVELPLELIEPLYLSLPQSNMRIKSILCGGIAVLSCTVTAKSPSEKKKIALHGDKSQEAYNARMA